MDKRDKGLYIKFTQKEIDLIDDCMQKMKILSRLGGVMPLGWAKNL